MPKHIENIGAFSFLGKKQKKIEKKRENMLLDSVLELSWVLASTLSFATQHQLGLGCVTERNKETEKRQRCNQRSLSSLYAFTHIPTFFILVRQSFEQTLLSSHHRLFFSTATFFFFQFASFLANCLCHTPNN